MNSFPLKEVISKYPVIAFLFFVLLYFSYVFYMYGHGRSDIIIKGFKQMTLLEKYLMVVKIFFAIFIIYFLFYRIMIMSGILGYPIPTVINTMVQLITNYLENVGLLVK